jgi:ATP-dependent Clp protease ATP-binding subunit ClpA
MFERYSEKARRVIFFARYDASRLRSDCIETEHLLLGVMREDPKMVQWLLDKEVTAEAFLAAIQANARVPETTQTNADLPLSNECKRVLAYTSEEAQRLNQRLIGTEHLLLGLMREKGSVAERLLTPNGADLARMRTRLATERVPDTSFQSGGQGEGRAGVPRPGAERGLAEKRKTGFDRYTEKARRVIFFARYEASQFGQGVIEPEHLLLGIGREGMLIMYELLGGEVPWVELRTRIEKKLGTTNPRISTSVDLPLSEASKRVLGFATEECDGLGGGSVGIGHVLLGLLREESSFAAQLLRERGADLQKIREKLRAP